MTKKDDGTIVKYNNELNFIPFKGMNQLENDVFFALLYKLKNRGTDEVTLEFSELKKLIKFNQSSEHIRQSIKGITKKIAQSIIEYKTDKTTKFFSIFQVLEIPNEGDYYIKAKISEIFVFLLNDVNSNFTLFELAEFSNLSSRYSQTLYRLLKQFRNTGFLTIDWKDFKCFLDIPKSYRVRDIDKQILQPAVKEFIEKDIFRDLKYEKIRGGGKGRPIEKIEFIFTTEIKGIKTDKEDLVFILQSEGVNKKTAMEYAEKAEKADKTKIILEKFDKMVKRAEKHNPKQKYLLGAIRNEIDGIQQMEIKDIALPLKVDNEEEKEFVYGEIPESAKKILKDFGISGLMK